MRHATWLLWIFAACGGDDGGATDVDGGSDAAVDAARAACRSPGAFTRDGVLTSTSGQPFHPTGIVADPHVVVEDGRYRMWLTSVDWTAGSLFEATDRVMGTAYLESSDGRVWDDTHMRASAAGHKVDLVLKPGAWDSEGVETISVVRTAGELVALHTGDRSDGTYAIGRARSTDGLTWQRDPAPLLDAVASWEQPLCIDPPACTQRIGGLFEPAFLVDADGTQHAWYAVYGLFGNDLGTAMGHAWSEDDGATWQRSATPVFEPGPSGAWDEILVSHTNVVADPSGGYHLFYQGISRTQQEQCSEDGACPFYTPGSIGHAYSPDGTTWTREAAPIIATDVTAGEGFFVGGPTAIIQDGRIEVFYFAMASREAASTLTAHLSRATAPCQ